MPGYELETLKLPKLTGASLKAFTAAVENPAGRAVLLGGLLENGGIPKLRRTCLQETPTFLPLIEPEPGTSEAPVTYCPGEPPDDLPYATAAHYRKGYLRGDFHPLEIAQRLLAAIESSEQAEIPLRAFVATDREDLLAQARASAERYAGGRPLSPLDGVPVAVKDEVDALPYPTTVGTRFLGSRPAEQDSTVAARLRAAGALIVGKTNMHEIGIAPNGYNDRAGAARNPYHTDCDTGGSSSGSAAAVAAGLVPVAVGADGGGSIRIPAALCGVVGLKPTYGRVSEAGAAPLCWSVAHLGPLAVSVEDTALAYAIMAGPDERDRNTLKQPPVTLKDWNRPDLQGLRIGIYRPWFEHASVEVAQSARAMAEGLRGQGAEICEVEIAELDEMRIAHAITILAEMAICMKDYRSQRKQMGLAVRLSLVLGEALSAGDYLQAQRMRARAMGIFARVFEQVDVILTPGTALAAQPVPAGGYQGGWSDLGTDTEMMRFVYPANLCGHPAISFPSGYDSRGLPLSAQAIGRHWQEHILLRVAFNAERIVKRQRAGRDHPVI